GGQQCDGFRTSIAELTKLSEVALFSSGRLAIVAALRALALPLGSSVVVQTYVCNAVVWAIEKAGCRPLLSDIDAHWCAGQRQIDFVMTSNVKAIILAPPFGFLQSPAPFRRYGLPIIHDLCQASVMSLSKAQANDLGDIVILSFHPTKYLCAGGAGAALTNDPSIGAALRRQARQLGEAAPVTEMQAAIGKAQLARIAWLAARRDQIARKYLEVSPRSCWQCLLEHLDVELGAMFRLPLRICEGTAAAKFPLFAERGIAVRHGVDQLAHRTLGEHDAKFPGAMRAYEETISLPFYPDLSDHEVDQVKMAIRDIL